jgi:hypothetical protein
MESKSVHVIGRQLPWTFLGRPRSMYIAAFQSAKSAASTQDELPPPDRHSPPGATMHTMKALTPDQIANWCHPTGNRDRWLDLSWIAHSDSTRSDPRTAVD